MTDLQRSRFTEEQIIGFLKQADTILVRIVHGSHKIALEGKSMRQPSSAALTIQPNRHATLMADTSATI